MPDVCLSMVIQFDHITQRIYLEEDIGTHGLDWTLPWTHFHVATVSLVTRHHEQEFT